MSKVLLPLAQGFEEIELVCIADILRRAKIEVTLASLTSSLEIKGAHHIALKAETSLQALRVDDFDAIVMHGGMEGVNHMLSSPLLLHVISEFANAQKIIGAICAAPLVLDELKLLNQDFCCYPGCEKMMKNTQNKRLNLAFKTSENLVTGTGPAFAMLFAIELVKNLTNHNVVQELKRELLLP
ncbi:DJ-1 family protein [Helicobacter cholecystus]|uniref:DJ-1 family protein n=1 Tax=Helicobacter cholecystus TaxID=45498 RepID=A0A3D8IYH5_9HELI|nr:DJ-1 family glyoxalase III [Helicobacter cholecystus]RDU69674.1 DJ-1 family protein [Helicobacter cholecystus]VEJ24238.1 4-methyl-5(beta-hydroxyethyl)-thiazole monophosphate synthesis protein [Helicobacter cholecystus]